MRKNGDGDNSENTNMRNSLISFESSRDSGKSGVSRRSSVLSEFSELKNDFMNWIFSGHSPNAIHSICYGLKDLLDPISRRHGVILTGAADGILKMWDPFSNNTFTHVSLIDTAIVCCFQTIQQ